MATRDLTDFFIRQRSAFHRKGYESGGRVSDGLLSSVGSSSTDASALALSGASPVYVETVNELQADLNSISTRCACSSQGCAPCAAYFFFSRTHPLPHHHPPHTHGTVEELTRLCDQRARIQFDPKLEGEKDREIEVVTNEITRSIHTGAKRLSRLGKHAESAVDASENKVVKNIITASARRLNELSLDFRKRQKQYLGARKRQMDGSGFGSILGAAGGGGEGGGDRDEGFTDAQMSELASAETEVDERMQEIQRIAKSVEDLAVLFKELNTLVVDQGTILDRIDFNMETTVQHVKKGMVELEKADDYSKRARPTKCMLILMVLIVIMVIVIIVRHSKK
jgi:syntaxin 16